MSHRAGRHRKLVRGVILSLQLLAAHRLRTALSISGLLVGVATVMVMVAVGEGAERRVLERVRALGTDVLIVSAAPAPRIAGRQRQSALMTTLRPNDAAAIAEESGAAIVVAPAVSQTLVAHREGRNSSTMLTGTTTDGLRIRNISVESGRLFDELEDQERRRVALLGPTIARNLFGDTDPIGREVRLSAVPFNVIGVLRVRGTDVGGTDLDNTVVIPLETALRRVLNIPYVHAIFIQARSSAQLDALEEEVRDILNRRHPVRSGNAPPFVIQNQAVLLRTERAAMRAFRRLIVGVAALGLLIGGAGVAAVMLMAVRERIREIGLRRALGARRRDIELQFVLESALLAATGGGAGVVVGFLASLAASALGLWDLVFSWRAAALALLSSACLGFVIGVFPASRAAGLEPIEALRAP